MMTRASFSSTKFLLVALLGMSLLASCGSTGNFTKSGKAEKAFVNEFLQEMVKYGDPKALWPYISPSYIEKQNIDTKTWLVDRYSPKSADIDSYDPKTGIVWGYIYFGDGTAHHLCFQLVKEGGKLYILGGERLNDVKYIRPWQKSTTNVKKSPTTN